MTKEIIYEKWFNMKKNDSMFSNKYFNIEIFTENSHTYIFLPGRWTSQDDRLVQVPDGWEFVMCKYENNEVDCSFLKKDVPLHITFKLTNKKEGDKRK